MGCKKKYEVEKYVTNERNIRSYTLARFLGSGKWKRNLVLFQGSYGNGKTHLMRLIKRELEQKHSHVRLVEAFEYQELVKNWVEMPAVMLNEIDSFDVLIMEDIDVLDGKIIWQKRLAGFLQAVLKENKQVIITANKPFVEMDVSLEQIFAEAYVEQIREPDEDLKLKFLRERVKEVSCEVPEVILKMISEVSVSIGRLKYIWDFLKFLHVEVNEILDKELVAWVINELCNPDEKKELQVVDLLFHEDRYSDAQIAQIVQVKEEYVKEKREGILKKYPVWNQLLCLINDDYVVLAKFWGAEKIEGHRVEEIEKYNHITETRRKNILKRIHLESRQIGGM